MLHRVPAAVDDQAVTIGGAFPEVLSAAQAGADWAWQRLYESVAARVRSYVAAQGALDPDELTGDVLLHLVRGIDRFSGDESAFRSWVFVIAHHRVIDDRRRSRRRQDLQQRLRATHEQGAEDDPLARLWPDEWSARLGQLSEGQRTVLLLRVVSGLSAEEVGRVIGKKAGAVRVMQHRAVVRLQEICAAEVTR